MSLFGKLIGGAVKTALTPLAVVSDTIKVISGEEPTSTEEHINSIIEDAEDILDGNV